MADGWTIAASVGTMIGGVAAAAGAWFARDAANASLATGRDAAEALALAMKPELGVNPAAASKDALEVVIINLSQWTATDVSVHATLRSGHVVERAVSEIGPHPQAITIDTADESLPAGVDLVIAAVDIRYGEERRHARWHARYEEPFDSLLSYQFDQRLA